jgi:hypothetical protein
MDKLVAGIVESISDAIGPISAEDLHCIAEDLVVHSCYRTPRLKREFLAPLSWESLELCMGGNGIW